jgi:Asp-tRNA(Asn)/Glu-tRNA(Gln) amidotransferase A subunit family amidase
MGLTSRAGVVPLNLRADIAGPMARTVADAVAIFQVIVGEDSADRVTALSRGRPREDYAAALQPDGLRGARIGVLHQAYDSPTADPEVLQVFAAALEDLRKAGAELVDPAAVDSLDAWRRAQTGTCAPFKWDLNVAGSAWRPRPVQRSRNHQIAAVPSLDRGPAADLPGDRAGSRAKPGLHQREEFRARLRVGVLRLMDSLRLDALVYPTGAILG